MAYLPSNLPQRPEDLPAWLQREFAKLSESLLREQNALSLTYLHAAPTRAKAGDLVLADGIDWNPGSGAGLYRRSSDNRAWNFVG